MSLNKCDFIDSDMHVYQTLSLPRKKNANLANLDNHGKMMQIAF